MKKSYVKFTGENNQGFPKGFILATSPEHAAQLIGSKKAVSSTEADYKKQDDAKERQAYAEKLKEDAEKLREEKIAEADAKVEARK